MDEQKAVKSKDRQVKQAALAACFSIEIFDIKLLRIQKIYTYLL